MMEDCEAGNIGKCRVCGTATDDEYEDLCDQCFVDQDNAAEDKEESETNDA